MRILSSSEMLHSSRNFLEHCFLVLVQFVDDGGDDDGGDDCDGDGGGK